jgi:acyl CoA:acetate/3-ketoacid CoA transferase beta subunit
MEHNAGEGEFKIVRECTYPLTAVGVVKKVFTDIAVLSIDANGFVLEEVAPGWTAEDVQSQSDAPLRISPTLHEMEMA